MQQLPDLDSLLVKRSRSSLTEALELIKPIVKQHATPSSIPEADWARLRNLPFRDLLYQRNAMASRAASLNVAFDDQFQKQVRVAFNCAFILLNIDLVRPAT